MKVFLCEIEQGRGQDGTLRRSAGEGKGGRKLTARTNDLGGATRKKIFDIVKKPRAWLSFLDIVKDILVDNVIQSLLNVYSDGR